MKRELETRQRLGALRDGSNMDSDVIVQKSLKGGVKLSLRPSDALRDFLLM